MEGGIFKILASQGSYTQVFTVQKLSSIKYLGVMITYHSMITLIIPDKISKNTNVVVKVKRLLGFHILTSLQPYLWLHTVG